jgi:hypothetical protein
MKKPKILMLGWEFPPYISGGLGVACYHLVRTLRKNNSLIYVAPRIKPGIKMAGIRFLSLADFNYEELLTKRERLVYFNYLKKAGQELIFTPYTVKSSALRTRKTKQGKIVKTIRTRISIENPLEEDELYGPNLPDKIKFYSGMILKLCRKKHFDIIHAHDWMTFPAALELKRITGKPLLLHIHSLNYDRVGPENQGFVFELEKEGLQVAEHILAVSHYTRNILQEHYGIPKIKITTVHNGAGKLKTFRTPKNFPEKMVLFLGRVTQQKGPAYFIDVAQQVIRDYDNVRFVIAGSGDQFPEIMNDVAYLELGHRIHFTGFLNRKKVHEIFSMADVFVMPSVSEPFGLSAIEAVQFGVPVILSRRAGSTEVLKGALVADFWDIERMTQYILRLLKDSKYREKIIQQGYKDLAKLSWEKSAEKIGGIYQKLLRT